MSWIYRAREVAEHEVYSLCHYRRFNEFQSLFRRQDNLIGRSPVDADMSHSVIRVSYCVFEFFDQLENNGNSLLNYHWTMCAIYLVTVFPSVNI